VSQGAICRYDSACLHDDAADVSIESARFEGYGPGGAAVIVDCLTDNRTRTVAELRHVFKTFGGNLGAPGSVAYLFKPVGRMTYLRGTDLQGLMRLGFGAGAEDIVVSSAGSIEVLTDPVEFEAVRAQFASAGFVPTRCDVTERASVPVPLDGAAAYSALALLQALRELDDVQAVYSNAEIPDALMAQL
jgi:transcriptional/translational regulatory protein YebC/TACO1